jgi:hypothetical protein
VPVVLTREEVQAVLSKMQGTYQLMAKLLYGALSTLALQSTPPAQAERRQVRTLKIVGDTLVTFLYSTLYSTIQFR